jgi:hypothetical protein
MCVSSKQHALSLTFHSISVHCPRSVKPRALIEQSICDCVIDRFYSHAAVKSLRNYAAFSTCALLHMRSVVSAIIYSGRSHLLPIFSSADSVYHWLWHIPEVIALHTPEHLCALGCCDDACSIGAAYSNASRIKPACFNVCICSC